MIRSLARMMAIAGVGLLTVGCSGEERTLVPVTGTVTYNGAPVEGAVVTFSSSTITAFDSTDAEGKFSLSTPRAGEGAEPGLYNVTVKKTTQAAPVEALDVPLAVPEVTGGAPPTSPLAGAETEDLLPVVYATLIQTPLRDYKVTAEGPNDFPIDLKDDAVPAAELPAVQAPPPTPTGV